jgi:hypothetical protein
MYSLLYIFLIKYILCYTYSLLYIFLIIHIPCYTYSLWYLFFIKYILYGIYSLLYVFFVILMLSIYPVFHWVGTYLNNHAICLDDLIFLSSLLILMWHGRFFSHFDTVVYSAISSNNKYSLRSCIMNIP